MIIATTTNYKKLIAKICKEDVISLDTETTGLDAYNGDVPFSVIIATHDEEYYFNFNTELSAELVDGERRYFKTILKKHILTNWNMFKPILEDENRKIFMHNAKFDLSMLHIVGLEVAAKVICTYALARIVRNDLPTRSLSYLGKLIGVEKSDLVEAYIKKHKLYKSEIPEGKKVKKITEKYFYLVPFEIITVYGCQDARTTLSLGEYEHKRLVKLNKDTPKGVKDNTELVINEINLTKVLYKMRNIGIKIDIDYCKKAIKHEELLYKNAEQEFVDLTGLPFSDGRTTLVEAFNKLGLSYPLTEAGNPSFAYDALMLHEGNELVDVILRHRNAFKRAGTYFANFIKFADKNNILHCSLNQGGTIHGRLSCSDPNLQNLPKHAEDKTTKYPIRKAFVPRKDFFFLFIDWDQVEYRLMLDYAEQMDLIEDINNGLDVHQATADRNDIERYKAKKLNFGLIYGEGAELIGKQLGMTKQAAYNMVQNYFRVLPDVCDFLEGAKEAAREKGFVYNWLGRKCHVREPYIAPNYIIAGGVGDIMKLAMNQVDEYLTYKISRMLLTVHDELVFEIHKTEQAIIPDLVKIMEHAYIPKFLKLTVGVEYGTKSWGEKVDKLCL